MEHNKHHKKQTEKKSKEETNKKPAKESNKNSKNEADENKKSLITVFVIIGIILVMFISTYFVSSYVREKQAEAKLKESMVNYNGFIFYKDNENHWLGQLNIRGKPYTIPFYYNPYQVENISLDNQSTIEKIMNFESVENGKIYITVDPEESSKIVVSAVEIARILGTANNIYNYNVSSAIIREIEQTTQYPVITCENQNTKVIVIELKISKENKIYSDKNCIILEATSADEMIKVADSFALRILTIIK